MNKKIFAILTLFASLFLLAGVYNAGQTSDSASAAVSNWQKSASIVPTSQTDFSSPQFKASLDQLKGDNANFVTLVIPWYQSNPWSVDIQRDWNTPTDESLISAINYAHSIGLNVALKPHMETHDKQWRAYINPGDREGWFSAYGGVLNHYADIAQAHNVELYILGSELISMAADNQNATNTQNWINMINNVRSRYSGEITYSANWGPSGFVDEKNNIAFWNHLDYIGLAGYFTLGFDWNNYDVETLKGHWDNWNKNQITPLQQRWNKPVLFTEIGYRSVDGAHTDPFDSGRGGAPNQQLQANAYEALFSYWDAQPFMTGVHLWDWQPDPNAGGAGTTTYTPQNKIAEGVMSEWFGRTGGTPPPPPPSEISFDIAGSAEPVSASPGQQIELTTEPTATGGTASNIIVNIEVHNNSGKVFQEYFEGQNFSAGETKNYSLNWTAPSEGEYTLMAGIFNSSWETLYKWRGDLAVINVSGGDNGTLPPPTPVSGEVDIWWPSESSAVSGTQPFKAVLQDAEIDSYEMFWQVDFDRLNPMFTSLEDWPHKEALVDVSGWNWRNSGPYAVNFVAKTLGGATLAERVVNIFIAR